MWPMVRSVYSTSNAYRNFLNVQIHFKFPHNLWRTGGSSHDSWSREEPQTLFQLHHPVMQGMNITPNWNHVLCFHCKTDPSCRFTSSMTYSAVHTVIFEPVAVFQIPQQWKEQPLQIRSSVISRYNQPVKNLENCSRIPLTGFYWWKVELLEVRLAEHVDEHRGCSVQEVTPLRETRMDSNTFQKAYTKTPSKKQFLIRWFLRPMAEA